MVKKRLVWLPILMALALGGLPVHSSFAKSQMKIHIIDIQQNKHKNLLGIPRKVDYSLKWMLYEKKDSLLSEIDFKNIPEYVVYYSKNDSLFKNAQQKKVTRQNEILLPNLKIGERYFFRIEGLNHGDRVALSDTAWAISGKALAGPSEASAGGSWLAYFPLSGRFPLQILGHGDVFERSTILGKFSFHLIWWFFLIGLIIWVVAMKRLSLSKIFPFEKLSLKNTIYLFNYDKVYSQRISKEFKKTLQKWQKLINEAYKLVESPPMEKIEKDGKEIIDLDMLEKSYATWWKDVGKIKIEKIEKELSRNGYVNYPTVRIIQAGLGNHKINGYRWLEASAEVDRAIENRASSELESLKRNSFLEWLWNLGATAPLLGLFGTVTGISVAFARLALLGEDTTHLKLVKMLAGGINEALWTTIMGLVAGIVLVILFYYYKNKLDWIYSKWEEIYVQVSEKL